MKKIYLTMIGFAVAGMAFSQRLALDPQPVKIPDVTSLGERAGTVDTITIHMEGCSPALYNSSGGGYVCGHNGYGDIAKYMLFDQAWGVTDFGTITGLCFWFGAKEGNDSDQVVATILADTNTILAQQGITYSQIDTSALATKAIKGIAEAAYNTAITLTSPVTIPANQTFFAGIALNPQAGDTVGLVSGTDGDFSAGTDHTWEVWSDGHYHDFSSWNLAIAMGIYPVMDFTINVDENDAFGVKLYNNYPNPASTQTSIMFDLVRDMQVSVAVFNVAGEQVMSVDAGMMSAGKRTINIDVNGLPAGVYSYTLNADGSQFSSQMMVVR